MSECSSLFRLDICSRSIVAYANHNFLLHSYTWMHVWLSELIIYLQFCAGHYQVQGKGLSDGTPVDSEMTNDERQVTGLQSVFLLRVHGITFHFMFPHLLLLPCPASPTCITVAMTSSSFYFSKWGFWATMKAIAELSDYCSRVTCVLAIRM